MPKETTKRPINYRLKLYEMYLKVHNSSALGDSIKPCTESLALECCVIRDYVSAIAIRDSRTVDGLKTYPDLQRAVNAAFSNCGDENIEALLLV